MTPTFSILIFEIVIQIHDRETQTNILIRSQSPYIFKDSY